MKYLGLEFEVKNKPVLDNDFIPLAQFNKAFLITAKKPLAVAVERNNGYTTVIDTFIHGTHDRRDADWFYVERIVKFLLWAMGGFKVYICGDDDMADYIKETYSDNGQRSFDKKFMERVYENKFEVISLSYDKKPAGKDMSRPVGRHLDGCRIGFDAGGSDRKVSAVVDGNAVFSEEIVWFPKINENPDYHYEHIVSAFKSAASHMPRVDAIGISSAGIYINNRVKVASLFLKVPEDLYKQKVEDIYIRAAKEIGDIPVEVINDGDVTALAGSMSLDDVNVLGIAMGTSEAAGYVDKSGNITGWLNELAFTPVDGNPGAMADEWSGDRGCGVKYFSQDAVIKLAPAAGIDLDESLSPAEKLKVVQKLIEEEDGRAVKINESIGCYLGHSLAHYANFYDIKHVLLLGRVMSGEGGNIIIKTAQKVLSEEYEELVGKFELHLPDKFLRRQLKIFPLGGGNIPPPSTPHWGVKVLRGYNEVLLRKIKYFTLLNMKC